MDARSERPIQATFLDGIRASLEEGLNRVVCQYFNLCAEEFLFYRLGYIDPAAWFAWQNGMRFYLANLRIRHLWEKDVKSNSYYGLQT